MKLFSLFIVNATFGYNWFDVEFFNLMEGFMCAVSAPGEGTAFFGRKNNGSVFCHFEKEQSVAKVLLPSYNVDVHNSSNCAKQKITNKTSSFFYDNIIKQYQSSKNSSCSIIKNAFLKNEKKLHSNVEFALRKRNLLWIHYNSKFSTKTLRPVMEDENFEFEKSNNKEYKPKKCKAKIAEKTKGKLAELQKKCNLNFEQRKTLLRLKKIKRRPQKEKVYPKHLDRIKVIDELDLNKRIEKLVKKVALENQQEEKCLANDCGFIIGPQKGKINDSSQEKKSFFSNIKKLFCFHKNFFNYKKRNVYNSVLVNKVRDKDSIAKKMALISNSNVSKTKKKNTRFKKNLYSSYKDFSDPAPIYRQNFIETPYPYSVNFMAKRCHLYPPATLQLFPESQRMSLRPRYKLEHWPFLKKSHFNARNMYDSRLKRYDMPIEEPIELPVIKEEGRASFKGTQDKTCIYNTESTNLEKISTEENEYSKATEEIMLSSLTLSENFQKSTSSNIDLNVTQEGKEDELPGHTLEKPILKRDLKNEKFEHYKPEQNFEAYESRYFNLETDSPVFDQNHFQPNLRHKYELPNNKYLRRLRFLKTRLAPRDYLVRNNVWSPNKRILFERKKRCGRKCCSKPRKCWRSPPLLCVPYIRKSQEDILKYLIEVMQKMIGKPLPLKREIFEKIKFKPFVPKEIYPSCDSAEEEIYECECDNAPSFYPEYLDVCPPPPSPQSLFRQNPKSFSSPYSPSSSYPSCSSTSKLYAASSYPPFFPYPNSIKISPDFAKSFFYANFNPLPLRQRPGFNSWPRVRLHAHRKEQTEKQNPIPYEEISATFSLETTSSVPVSTKSAASTTFGANVSSSSQIVVSVPLYTNTSYLNAAKPSSLKDSFASDFNASLPHSVPTTTATPITSTDFERDSPTFSTISACALYVSNLPVGMKKHFSCTAVPYNGEPECATVTDWNSETTPPTLLDQQPIFYNPVESKKLYCNTDIAEADNTSPNTQKVVEWPSTTNPLLTTETFYYKSQLKETPKSFKELYETPQEFPLDYNYFGKDDRSRNFNLSRSIKEDFEKSFQYNDNLQNERPVWEPKNRLKGFFRMKHKSKFISKPLPTEFLPPYDYYVYDKYPIMRPNDNNNMKLGRYPVPQLFWRDFERKIKTNNNPKSLIRRKRRDYDYRSDNFDSYSDYFDDPNYNDEDSDKHPGLYAECSGKNCLNSEDTSPSYEMLSELAKIITEFNDTQPESTKPMSSATGFNYTSTFDSTNPITKLPLSKSSTNGVSNFQVIKSTSSETGDKVQNNNRRPVAKTQSNSKFSNLPNYMSATQTSLITATTDTKTIIKDKAIDFKKSGKMSFFQTNSKIIQTPKNSKKDSGKEEKELDSNKDIKTEELGQIPTTLKTAVIIKGQKKSLTKPSTKVYPKVFPDFFPSDVETNDTTNANTVTSTIKASTENRAALLSSTSKPDIKLQLLAVCEGYLEIVKLIKGQNQTTEGDLDADLARYCENIISQSFNNQLEKPKKPELIEFSPQNTNTREEMAESYFKKAEKTQLGSQAGYEIAKDFSESQLREKIMTDTLKEPVYTKKTAVKANGADKITSNNDNDNVNNNYNYNYNDDDDDDDDNDDKNVMDKEESENDGNNNCNSNNTTKKNERERLHEFIELETTDSTETTEVGVMRKKDNDSLKQCFIKKQKKLQREEKKTEKGLSKEDVKMLKILKNRKKELLSWLFNLKDRSKLDVDVADETECLDDEDLSTETETPKISGTSKPKRGKKKSGRTKKNLLFNKESDFPIYAKRYGYDKGGELREVEVLWRKINKKTHEEKVFKSMNVLALVMTSPDETNKDTKFVVNDGSEETAEAEIERNKLGYAAVGVDKCSKKTTVPVVVELKEILKNTSSTTLCSNSSTKSMEKNLTDTYKCKPDSSFIVGECSKVKKPHPNTTRKTSHKMEVAKGIFQEYTIEFVNYAVYILPVMLTIIFLFCCLCCALHILKAQQSLKRHRKKKKRQYTTDDTSDTTEESGHSKKSHSKKKKREVKIQKRPENLESDTVVDKAGLKKFWSALKPTRLSNKVKKENCQESKRNSLLRFLKDNKKKKSFESDYHYLAGKEKEGDVNCHRTDDRREAAERRELIALLEEVKKIEMGQMDCTKEPETIQVQCMTQEDDSSVFKRPFVLYPHQKKAFGTAKGYSFGNKPYTCQQTDPNTVDNPELYEDVSELTELLPCECTYLSKKSDCLRHCDFSLNQQDPCRRFLKILRNSGMCQNRHYVEKNLVKNESENRSFIFNKYRSISMEPSKELMGVTQKNAGTEIKLSDITPPLALPCQENAGILKEIDNLKRQLKSKKNVRLKDDGVLCRL